MASNASVITSPARLRPGLGTFVAVEALSADASIREQATVAAFAAIADVERLMHPTRAGSDLAALRDHRPGSPLRIHPWTWQVLGLSQRLYQLSDGLFDPCLPEAPGRLSDLELVAADPVSPTAPCSVVLRRRVHLDLGGIAKGFAVDRALDALRAAGCAGGLVNAGGDLAVFGDRTHRIECRPHGGGTVPVRNAALATSVALSADVDPQDRPVEHRGHYHGVTRRPLRPGHAIVTAPTAALADALTKCVLAGDNGGCRDLLVALGACRIQF